MSETFFPTIITRGTSDAFYVWPATTGCYAIQVDGPAFEDAIVIKAG